MTEEDHSEWDEWMNFDNMVLQTLGKGKSLGKGSGLLKLHKCRDSLLREVNDFEEALGKVKNSTYMSSANLEDKLALLKELQSHLQKVKKSLAKGSENAMGDVKGLLVESAQVLKQAREMKELIQLANKTGSKVSRKK